MATRPKIPDVPDELIGKWIAWNRNDAQIVGCGETFESAKDAAAKAGNREVMIAKSNRWLKGKHLLCMAAVFTSQAAESVADLSDLWW